MSFNLDDVNVGGQLKVGSGVVPAVGEGDKRVNGSVYAEGPVQLGDQGAGFRQAFLQSSFPKQDLERPRNEPMPSLDDRE